MKQACIVFVMGVSGSGKTTVGEKLAKKMKMPFYEGDNFHSQANKEKMKSGHPLTDKDRAGWLKRLNELAKEEINKKGAVIACSALKEKYRIILSKGINIPLFWVYMKGSYRLIKKRMQERKGHYMPVSLLKSQFDALEEPTDAIKINISKSPAEIVEAALSKIEKALKSKNLD